MGRPVSTHWLRENAQERSPRRVLFVDTETAPASADDQDRQLLRLWCARLVRRRGIDPKLPRTEDFAGATALELSELIGRLARSDASLWIMAHNLNFDLAVTALPVLLTDAGWRITEGALTTDNPWCRLIRGSRRLTITDSWSWLPAGVGDIGQLVGLHKLELPEWDDAEDDWRRRCERDVQIIAKAIGQLMDWWDAGHFGNWSITGPATGWSSYRHRRPAPRVLIDPDPAARALESRAVTGGRRELRRVGRLPDGLYADLDLATAHLTAMADRPLPVRRLRAFDSLPVDDPRLGSQLLDVLAECVVHTDSPRYPWDSGRGIFYPTGTFAAVLAGPELRDARARGELLSIGRGYSYLVGLHMRPWALWLASLLAAETPGIPPAVRLMAKHWSRCVPGKWAGHTSEVLSRTPDPRPGWGVERGFVSTGRRQADFLRVGGELWTITRDEWADDAFPAILAWIQSYTRVTVGRLIDRLGPAMISANTDGVLVDVDRVTDQADIELGAYRMAPTRRLQSLDTLAAGWDALLAPFAVRVKSAASVLTVISPQHLILDGERRLAGIPRRAQALAGGRYRFTAWPRLRVQLARPLPIGYQTVRRTVNLEAIAPAGWLWADGHVTAPEVDGDTILPPPRLPWAAGPDPDHSLAPRERQHVALRAAYDAGTVSLPAVDLTRRPQRPAKARRAS